MGERVYRLKRGPWQRKHIGFGVSQAVGSPRFQPNDGVMVSMYCLWSNSQPTELLNSTAAIAAKEILQNRAEDHPS